MGDRGAEDARRSHAAGGQAASRFGQPRCVPRLARKRSSIARPSATRIPAGPSRSIGSTARQYQNAIRDLLNLEIDVTSLLPSDDSSYGFDNIAGVLKMSPTLMERYLSAAQKISRAAVGTPPPTPTVDYFRVADDLAQDRRLPGQSFGTRGGTRIRYTFPMDAQYAIRVQLSRDLNEGVPLYAEDQQLEVSVDGERVKVFTLPGVGQPAGQSAAAEEPPQDFDTPAPHGKCRCHAAAGPGEARRRTSRKRAGARAPRAHRQVAARARLNRQGLEQRNRADRDWEVRVPIKAGTRDVEVAFINPTSALAETARLPFSASVSGRREHRRDADGRLPAQRRDQRSLRSDGTGTVAEPRADFQLPAREAGGRARRAPRPFLATLARHAYRRPVDRRRRRAAARVLQRGPQERRVRRRRRAGAQASACRSGVPASHRGRSGGRPAEYARTESAIWSWPRACRSSSGTASRTRSC